MSTPAPIRLALADDHVIVRKGISEIISSFGGFIVNLEANNGEELIKKLSEAKELPDICVLDVNMPHMNGYDTLTELKKHWPNLKVLVLTMFNNEYAIIKMLRNGANGYILKNCDPRELEAALHSIYKNGFYHMEIVSSRLVQLQQSIPKINTKEMQFLSLCCSDLNYKEIAQIMGMSTRTVEGYRDSLFEKLNIRTRTGLVIYAMSIGIMPYKTGEGNNNDAMAN